MNVQEEEKKRTTSRYDSAPFQATPTLFQVRVPDAQVRADFYSTLDRPPVRSTEVWCVVWCTIRDDVS